MKDFLDMIFDPSQHLKAGHYRLTRETPFEWHFSGETIVAHLLRNTDVDRGRERHYDR